MSVDIERFYYNAKEQTDFGRYFTLFEADTNMSQNAANQFFKNTDVVNVQRSCQPAIIIFSEQPFAAG